MKTRNLKLDKTTRVRIIAIGEGESRDGYSRRSRGKCSTLAGLRMMIMEELSGK